MNILKYVAYFVLTLTCMLYLLTLAGTIEVEDEKNIIFKVQVADGDMGKIIGRQGKIAQSIRTVMKAVANRKDKKVNVEFIDD